MCMMIYHPARATPFEKSEFADFHRKNPNGFGMIWRQADRLHVRKGMMKLDETWQLYRRRLNDGVREMALHWRFATSGARTYDQCHPFDVGEVTLMHNGVLSHRSTMELSDTQCFIADVLEKTLTEDPAIVRWKEWTDWLDRRIGPSNKMILWQEADASPVIVGERKGLWHRGRWYSNTYAWTVPWDVVRRYTTFESV